MLITQKLKAITVDDGIVYSPAEHAEDEIEHEEGSYNNERDKIRPCEICAYSVVCLQNIDNIYPFQSTP